MVGVGRSSEVRAPVSPATVAPPEPDGGESDAPLGRYLPTLSLVRGLATGFALQTSATLFKNLGVSNAIIGYLSLFSLPASLKFLWGPVADCYGTKRGWAIGAGCSVGGCLLAMALLLLREPVSIPAMIVLFGLCAAAQGLSDFASEGFFVCAVRPVARATGLVLMTAFSRLGLASLSIAIFLAGFFSDRFHSLRLGWAAALAILGGAIMVLTAYNYFAMPRPAADRPAKPEGGGVPWRRIFDSYRETPRFWVVTAFIVTFRFGENIVMRLSQVFFVEDRATGGLGLSLQQVSFVGGAALGTSILGGLLSIGIIKRFGIRRTMVPLSLAMLAPNVLYVLLALFPTQQVAVVTIVACAEYLGYGLGFTFYFSVVVALAHGPYRASHMAFGNAVMLLGVVVPNAIGGVLQEAVGWTGLFLFAVIGCIPGFCLMFFLPPAVVDTDRPA